MVMLLAIWSSPTLADENMTVAPSGNAMVSGSDRVVQYLVYPESASRSSDLEHDIEVIFDHQKVQVFRNYRSAIHFWLIVMTFREYNEFRSRHPEVGR